jgi:membrane associated rhomboid family serine protease
MTEEEPPNLFDRAWRVPWHAHILPAVLAILLFGIWLATPTPVVTAMTLSSQGLAHGNWASVILHMFAHGGIAHVLVNIVALLAVSAPLITSLGTPPLSWGRYIYLFLGSGLSGAALFLLLDRTGTSAMLGASGAIFGLLGALARVHPQTGLVVPVRSTRTWLLAKGFVRDHALLFGLLGLASLLGAHLAAIAWQAHLGGLLFGVFAASLFLERDERQSKPNGR